MKERYEVVDESSIKDNQNGEILDDKIILQTILKKLEEIEKSIR